MKYRLHEFEKKLLVKQTGRGGRKNEMAGLLNKLRENLKQEER